MALQGFDSPPRTQPTTGGKQHDTLDTLETAPNGVLTVQAARGQAPPQVPPSPTDNPSGTHEPLANEPGKPNVKGLDWPP